MFESRVGDIIIRESRPNHFEIRRVIEPLLNFSGQEKLNESDQGSLAIACDGAAFSLSGDQKLWIADEKGRIRQYAPGPN